MRFRERTKIRCLASLHSKSERSRWCNGSHKTLLRSWSWFDSRSGHLEIGPWVCRTACQLPKLLDQVRLLDGLLDKDGLRV